MSAPLAAQKGELDPFAVAVMQEVGIDISRHKPITFEELEDLEGLNFDLIVTLAACTSQGFGVDPRGCIRCRILADD
jgi:protein-tyrosine-phosphatase